MPETFTFSTSSEENVAEPSSSDAPVDGPSNAGDSADSADAGGFGGAGIFADAGDSGDCRPVDDGTDMCGHIVDASASPAPIRAIVPAFMFSYSADFGFQCVPMFVIVYGPLMCRCEVAMQRLEHRLDCGFVAKGRGWF